LKDNEIEGARYILLNITSGTKEVTMDEVAIVTDYIQEKAGLTADLIWGNCIDETLDEELSVTIIATGFQTSEQRIKEKEMEKVALPLTPETPLSYVKPVVQNQFVERTVVKAEETFVKPVTPTNVVTTAPSADLFTTPKTNNSASVQNAATVQVESHVIRHTLDLSDDLVEDTLPAEELNSGFELKTSPSIFEFKLPSVFDAFDEPSNKEVAQEESNVVATNSVSTSVPAVEESVNFEDQLLKTKERILRLKELSMKLKSSNGLQELETEPAYKRKQKTLDDVPYSNDSQVSRFTLSFDDGVTEIRSNNSFLHDNVD